MQLDSTEFEMALADAVRNYRGVPPGLAVALAMARVTVAIAETSADGTLQEKRAELALLEVQAAYALLAGGSVLTSPSL